MPDDTLPIGYQTLGTEGSTLYFVDGTRYPYFGQPGFAVQVWEWRHGRKMKYCLLSGWKDSTAYKRIQADEHRPRRSIYDEYGANIFFTGELVRGEPL